MSKELVTPPILPKIDINELFSTDNGGLALTVEMEQWFHDVVKVLNYVVQQIEINDNKTRDELAKLILMINHKQYPPNEETKKVICGYCYYDQGTHNPDGSCPYMKGSSKDLDGTFAPDSTPLKIDTNDWWKGEDGRYSHKP